MFCTWNVKTCLAGTRRRTQVILRWNATDLRAYADCAMEHSIEPQMERVYHPVGAAEPWNAITEHRAIRDNLTSLNNGTRSRLSCLIFLPNEQTLTCIQIHWERLPAADLFTICELRVRRLINHLNLSDDIRTSWWNIDRAIRAVTKYADNRNSTC